MRSRKLKETQSERGGQSSPVNGRAPVLKRTTRIGLKGMANLPNSAYSRTKGAILRKRTKTGYWGGISSGVLPRTEAT